MASTDNNPVKSKKDLMRERMNAKYPDKNFDDEDAFFGQISDEYDDYDKQIAEYKEREGKFSEMFTSDPRSARFLMDWKDGQDPAISLIRQFGTEIKDVIDDPERQEEISAANKEFVERVAKEKELEETYKKNIQESLSVLEKLQAENGISDEDIDKAMEFVIAIVSDGIMGKFTPETIDMAIKAIKHDADVAQASHEGEIKGKNSKIEEKLRTKGKGDGTAHLDGKNGKGGQKTQLPNIGALNKYSDNNKNIWELGEEKRTKH